MKIEINRLDDAFHFEATNEEGKTVQVDGGLAIGGHNNAMRPMQLLLSAIGTCSAFDMLVILKKQRQLVKDLTITVTGERAKDTTPTPFTEIDMKFMFYGDLDRTKVEKAVQMGVEKYCSVAATFDKSIKITYSFEVLG
jgi:putative redox protein